MCLFPNRQPKTPSTDLGFQQPLKRMSPFAPFSTTPEDDSQTLR